MVPVFIVDFNLLGCKLDNFTFKVLCWVILYYIKTKYNHDILTLPFEKSKTISFASSVMKNIVEPCSTYNALSRFLVKLICCIAFWSASNFCCLLKSVAINL